MASRSEDNNMSRKEIGDARSEGECATDLLPAMCEQSEHVRKYPSEETLQNTETNASTEVNLSKVRSKDGYEIKHLDAHATDIELRELSAKLINVIDGIGKSDGEIHKLENGVTSGKESLNADVEKLRSNNNPVKLDVMSAAKVVNSMKVSNGCLQISDNNFTHIVNTGYCNNGYINDQGFEKYLESQGITSIVNENFDEKKTYRLSDNSSDSQMINTVSRRIDLKRKKGVKVRTKFVQGKSRDRASWGGKGSQDKFPPGEKLRIIRNLVVVGTSFMLQFTAFFAATNLQSSLNAKGGLGTASLVAIYAGLIVSNMFLPVLVIRWLGCKWTMAVSFLTYTPYLMAQFDAQFYTLIPAALLLGFGGGPLWCAKCTYLSVLAETYANITETAKDKVLVRFFGFFYVLFPLSQVWGNIISYSVLSSGEDIHIWNNVTNICGANYCPGVALDSNPNMERPPEWKIFTVMGIFLACMVAAAFLVAFGIDSLTRYDINRSSVSNGLSGFKLLAVTAKNLMNRNQLLLLPITSLLGMSQAFLSADFTEGYISCTWGISHIGYILICYGVCNAVSAAFLSSVAVRILGRIPVVSAAFVMYLCTIATLKFWQPNQEQSYLYFVIMVLWGFADSAFLVINAMYGLIFVGNEEAAFSNFRLWEAVGFIVSYAYSVHLCMNAKLLIMLLLLLLSAAGYLIVEFTTLAIEPEVQKVSRELPGSPENGMVEISLKQYRAM